MNRAVDTVLAGVGLVVSSPFLAASAAAIKLDDRGPVLYRQERVGQDGRPFELLKLRTMEVGAETRGAGYAVNRASCGRCRSTSCRSSGTSSAARCP